MAEFNRCRKPVPSNAVRVVLTANNATLALVCGALRRHANFAKSNSSSYKGNKHLQPEAFASPAGCAAEIAVAQHLGQSWNARAWPESDHGRFRDVPDVGHSIEVKRIRDNKQYVEVKKKETGRGRILWVVRTVGLEHLELDLLGWIPYDHAWAMGEQTVRANGKVDPESRTIPLSVLKPCPCLTGDPTHHNPEPLVEGEFFTVPTSPPNGAGYDNPDCVSHQSVDAVVSLFAAANANNPLMRLAPPA